jgi:hypothetical protein
LQPGGAIGCGTKRPAHRDGRRPSAYFDLNLPRSAHSARRFQLQRNKLLENGTAENNRKVRDIRPRSDEELALVLNQGTGAQELMLVGKGYKRTAAECCFEQD